jgi:integrase
MSAFLSDLLERGVPIKMVSEILSHAGTTIANDLYVHVMPTMQRQAVAAMEAVLGA